MCTINYLDTILIEMLPYALNIVQSLMFFYNVIIKIAYTYCILMIRTFCYFMSVQSKPERFGYYNIQYSRVDSSTLQMKNAENNNIHYLYYLSVY